MWTHVYKNKHEKKYAANFLQIYTNQGSFIRNSKQAYNAIITIYLVNVTTEGLDELV